MASIGMHLAFAAAAAGRRRASPSSSVHRHAARCRPPPPPHHHPNPMHGRAEIETRSPLLPPSTQRHRPATPTARPTPKTPITIKAWRQSRRGACARARDGHCRTQLRGGKAGPGECLRRRWRVRARNQGLSQSGSFPNEDNGGPAARSLIDPAGPLRCARKLPHTLLVKTSTKSSSP